jgi:CRP/FNR family transcriptional regulator
MKIISVEMIKKLFPDAIERTYEKKQIVCHDGDKPNTVYFILEGHIKLYDIDDQGNEKILHINGPNNLFPMLYAYNYTKEIDGFYACLDKTRLLVIPITSFKSTVDNNHELAKTLMDWFLGEIQELIFRLSAMEKNDARNKILFALKSLSLYYSHREGSWMAIDFPITRQFMADYTGLARETVSIAMSELEKDKIIRRNLSKEIEVKVDALPISF